MARLFTRRCSPINRGARDVIIQRVPIRGVCDSLCDSDSPRDSPPAKDSPESN